MLKGSPRERPILEHNLLQLREQIQRAATRSRRSADEVTLVAVTKAVSPETAANLCQLGIVDMGENRLQIAEQKIDALGPQIRWHLIGHLQRNKVKKALLLFNLIHSVDSVRLAREINREAKNRGLTAQILLQVNVSNEDSKFGFSSSELEENLSELGKLDNLAIEGLMTMAPYSSDPEESRPWFRGLCDLRTKVQEQTSWPLPHLSMGMSRDYVVAIEEGATMIRVGTALYEGI